MEYVPGEAITSYCDRQRLSTRERIELFAQVCEGVQHAHQKAVIHRDLKLSNVLVTLVGDKPVPKIIDFGVAKATNQRLTERTLYTEMGRIIGTPEYMSPEQAEMGAMDIDTRTDVYSLGVLLYELLVGELPFDSGALRQAGYAAMQVMIREAEPPKPSTRLSSLGEESKHVAERRRTELGRLRRELRGDLDWVVMKTIEKDRTRRYSTVAELAADLRRHLEHEPVLAGPPGVGYRLKKLVRKHRGPMLAASAVALALAAGLIASIVFALDARESAREARDNLDLAKSNESRALAGETLAKERLEDVLRLADVKRLQDYLAEAEELRSALPEKVEVMEAWIKKAEALVPRLETHRSTLAALPEKALPYDEAQRAADRASHPEAGRLAELQDERTRLLDEAKILLAEHGEEPRATLLSFRVYPKKKLRAAYFRHGFEIGPDGDGKVEELKLHLTADDGTVVYLNGKEVLRVSDAAEDTPAREHTLAGTALNPGRNLVAVEVRQTEAADSDLVMKLELVAGEKVFVPAGALWRYNVRPKGQPSGWRAPGFDDSSWPEGPAPLGYGFASGPGRLLELRKSLEDLEASIADLEKSVSERCTWRFAATEVQWQHDTMAGLVEGIERLADADPRKGALASVRERIEFARTVEKRTVEDHRKAWHEAIAAIRADPRYKGLTLKPQVGLIPIGQDPESKLWEFAHLQTGKPAKPGGDGKLMLTEETGLVFVLLPGGTFFMGAERATLGIELGVGGKLRVGKITPGSLGEKLGLQRGDVLVSLNGSPLRGNQDVEQALSALRSRAEVTVECRRGEAERSLRAALGPNIDPHAERRDDSPVHEVTLAHFFLSKYEMTQGQWQRFTGENPSVYVPTAKFEGKQHSLLHPVERVSWEMCDATLRHLGLLLPTEAQWEYGCRGGTESVWWTGDEHESLRGKVNLADQSAVRYAGARWPGTRDSPDFVGGYVAHAPVGTFAANAFGLHEVHGNQWEWCRDSYGDYKLTPGKGDGERPGRSIGDLFRIIRGGSFTSDAFSARAGFRNNYTPTTRDLDNGLRPSAAVRE
jgi:formylglycine-generating enzyme required for sulfatase activity